ncbi:MAG TPA: DUF4131 domain-containing protein, partial [Flavitalea sp.]|nr:DUF4131 domain-containing protein [Flavitalea sp.]
MPANFQFAGMNKYHLACWKESPSIRIIIPFIAGIAISYYTALQEITFLAIMVIALCAVTCYAQLNLNLKFRYRYVVGVMMNIFIAGAGGYLAGIKNPFKKQNVLLQFNNQHQTPVYFITVSEPPAEKKSSWKAECRIDYIHIEQKIIYPETNMLLYIRKDSNLKLPVYGSRIAFRKNPERIKNFIASSSFDYQRYCSLKNIHYQVFVRSSEFIQLDGKNANPINEFL